ncbi:MAG: tetratricopeptide repeat protein [Alphaproteobacteria bacterium]
MTDQRRLRRAGAGRGGFVAAAVVLGGTCLAPPPAAAIAPEAFLQLPAVEAFKAGRFQEAIDGLRALPIAGPEDAIILRYIALAYQQLGDHTAAVAAIDEGLAVAPDNAALYYFRAVSLLELGRAEDALAALERVQALAPDSLYAQQSLQMTAALRALTGGGEAPAAAAESTWQASLEAGAQYDSNIPAAPDGFGSKTGGFRLFQRATGSGELWRSGAWRQTVQGEAYSSEHLDSEFGDFNTITASLGTGIDWQTSVGDVPASLGLGYGFEATWVGGDPYSRIHTVDLTALAALDEDWLTQLRYGLSLEEYEDDGVLPTITSRDGVGHSLGLTQYWFVDGRDSFLYAGYAFGWTTAEGSNFDRRSHTLIGGGLTRVVKDIRLDAGVTYLHEDYPDFIGPQQRRTDRFDLTFGAAKEIFDNTEISASWTYIDENSSIDVLSYDQHVATVSLIVSF